MRHRMVLTEAPNILCGITTAGIGTHLVIEGSLVWQTPKFCAILMLSL